MAPLRTRTELSALNIIAPDFEKHIKARPLTLPDWAQDLNATRVERANHLASLKHLLPIPAAAPDVIEEKDVFIPADDGYEIRVRVYAPARPDRKDYPVIVLYHEGGWCFGDLSDEEMNARMFARDLGAVCLNVEYRLAPENQFPRGVDDCYIALKAAATRPELFHELADPALGLVVGGSSAGGNLSAVLAHRAREDRLSPAVSGQWLSCGFLVMTDLVPEKYKDEYISSSENLNDPVIGPLPYEKEKGLAMTVGATEFDHPLLHPFAPALYPPAKHDQEGKPALARAYLSVAGMDPIRDDSLIYERALREEWGVRTKLDLYPGYGHMFWMNWPEMDESKKFWKQTLEGMRWLLQN